MGRYVALLALLSLCTVVCTALYFTLRATKGVGFLFLFFLINSFDCDVDYDYEYDFFLLLEGLRGRGRLRSLFSPKK